MKDADVEVLAEGELRKRKELRASSSTDARSEVEPKSSTNPLSHEFKRAKVTGKWVQIVEKMAHLTTKGLGDMERVGFSQMRIGHARKSVAKTTQEEGRREGLGVRKVHSRDTGAAQEDKSGRRAEVDELQRCCRAGAS